MKNIIVCCDGTGNEYGTNNTNVVTAYALAEESAQQCRYYDPGIGTGGWVYEEDAGTLRAAMDQATGHGLRKNVEDAYRFLMQAYEDDDRVYLFGFSRGAFTVRSLAGMLHRCGLLRPTAANLVEYASKLYHQEDGDNGGEEVDAGFRATFARPCPVHFIGVWDTVESLILNAGRKWHDTRLSPETAFAYPIFNMPTSNFFHIRQLRCLERASGTTSARQRFFYTMFLRIPPGAESMPMAS